MYGQKLPKKPSESDVRAYNQSNLLKIDLGVDKATVIREMGGVQNIQTYPVLTVMNWGMRGKTVVISNPYSRDLKYGKDSTVIEILWYYTDLKNADGAINKEELTPIILENNKVAGLGWGFYQDYAKKKEITIDLR